MKKLHIFFINITLIINLFSQNNSIPNYVSELFTGELSKTIQTEIAAKYHDNLCATYDSSLIIISNKGFQNSKRPGYAAVSKFNFINGIEETFLISPPHTYLNNGGRQDRIWIWAIASSNTLLSLAVDKEIWIYQYTDSNEYKHIHTVAIENVMQMEIVDNYLHAFVENNEGYDWYKINFENFEVEKVRLLALKNPFFLQIIPAKLIAMNNHALYFLQRNEPTVEKYSLSGELLANYSFELPNWNKIPENITQQLDDIQDITERNYAFAKLSIFERNFMLLFYVFHSERFLMFAVDKNEQKKTYITPYFIQIIGDTTIVKPYSVKLNDTEKFGERIFPFQIPRAEGNLIFAQQNEYVAQINLSTNTDWKNKTQKEYLMEVDKYHRDHDPVQKFETFKFVKNCIPPDSILFLDYDNHIVSLNDVKKDKAIFILSQYPFCSACLKTIWNYFSNKKLPNVELFNVASDCPTYLKKKENLKEVNYFLQNDFTPLFFDSKELNAETKLLLTQKSYPLVILFDKKLQHIEVIPSASIIGDFMGNLSDTFIHTIDNFLND